MVVILMRNLEPPILCNGTRMRIKKMYRNFVECVILTGSGSGQVTEIWNMQITPTEYPIKFVRSQLPLHPAFAITINKSQGQTFRVCGISLNPGVFTHGQLYVALSRVGLPDELCIYSGGEVVTPNFVYQEVLQ